MPRHLARRSTIRRSTPRVPRPQFPRPLSFASRGAARTRRPDLTAHGSDGGDDLYGTVLVKALESDVCVLTGTDLADVVPAGFVGHLAEDLRTAGHPVIADVSDETVRSVASGAPAVLKMSHDQLVAGGSAADDDTYSPLDAARRLVDRGVGAVVVSRVAEPGMLVTR